MDADQPYVRLGRPRPTALLEGGALVHVPLEYADPQIIHLWMDLLRRRMTAPATAPQNSPDTPFFVLMSYGIEFNIDTAAEIEPRLQALGSWVSEVNAEYARDAARRHEDTMNAEALHEKLREERDRRQEEFDRFIADRYGGGPAD